MCTGPAHSGPREFCLGLVSSKVASFLPHSASRVTNKTLDNILCHYCFVQRAKSWQDDYSFLLSNEALGESGPSGCEAPVNACSVIAPSIFPKQKTKTMSSYSLVTQYLPLFPRHSIPYGEQKQWRVTQRWKTLGSNSPNLPQVRLQQ